MDRNMQRMSTIKKATKKIRGFWDRYAESFSFNLSEKRVWSDAVSI
jgi:hypothetical protein